MPCCEDGQEFPKLSPVHATAVTAPTGTQHVTQVAERGLHIKHGFTIST